MFLKNIFFLYKSLKTCLTNYSGNSKSAMYAHILPNCCSIHKAMNNSLIAQFKFSTCSIISAAFLVLFGSQITKVVIFFLPLAVSTIGCSIPIILFLVSEKNVSKEVTLLEAESAELPLVQVCTEANSSVYGGQMEAGCFLQKIDRDSTDCGADDEGKNIVLAGRIEVKNGQGFFDEDLASLNVDCLAAGLWNSYFDGCSKWSYVSTENLEINHLNIT